MHRHGPSLFNCPVYAARQAEVRTRDTIIIIGLSNIIAELVLVVPAQSTLSCYGATVGEREI